MAIDIDIQKQYDDFILDFHLHTNAKRIGILGSSGSGKSLSLKCIAGILKPEQGKIVLDDQTLYDSKRKMNRKPQERKVGYLFQNYALFPNMTVLENIKMGIQGKRKEDAKDYIERFHLKGLEGHYPDQLSGGQQQRVALARIMASKPQAILLDEPFSAMDVNLKDQLQHELKNMLSEYDGTVILVSHNRDEIYRFCEELVILDDGKTICQGKVKTIFQNPKTKVAARLTGCKNIVAVERIDSHHLKIPAWNAELVLTQSIPESVHFLGIRAHDFIPSWEKESNGIKMGEAVLEEMPFERQYYIYCREETEPIRWFVARDQYPGIDRDGLPTYLTVTEEKILLLN